ncbi:alpha/beta hydrolase [Aliidiomarina taiwanensis]|uniref:Alpha/beta hydrolase n=1 Tax=Aliidiomarina taiwanensis TaxID=946228 RepID=A0A432X205_9GAMM|nr:alpha/beta hydrolase [Aliidiomarina taiwanensis]RUO40575.1 alpha/beta hydrolase [Aliidiomarina taiwanensis]
MIPISIHINELELAGFSSTSTPLEQIETPTLALHGWLDNAASFAPLWPHLDTHPLLALDFPGHGLSSHRSAGAAYYFIEWAADIIALIEQYDWQQVHLIGHSMGAFISQLVASVMPERIAAMSLIEGFGMLTFKAEETREKLKKALVQRRELASKRAPVYPDKERIIRVRAETSQVTPAQIVGIVERNLMPVEGGWSWRVDPRVRLGSPFRFTLEQANDLMAGIQCPVQLIRGEQGFPELTRAVQQWSGTLTHFEQVELSGGHHVHLEYPEQVAKEINAFLRRLN